MNIEHRSISRRAVLGRMGVLGAGALIGIGKLYSDWNLKAPIIKGLVDAAKAIPERGEEEKISYPNPGWLETGLPDRPHLLNSRNGAAEYLRYMVLHSDVLKKAARRANNELMGSDAPSAPPKLGDMLSVYLEVAEKALHEEYPDTVPSLSNKVHAAMFTLAANVSPYLTPSHQDYQDYFPRVFPVEREPGTDKIDYKMRYEGTDRAIHAFQHAFAAYQYSYGVENGLTEKDSMPFGLWLILNLSRGTPEEKAKLESLIMGMVWEVIETEQFFKDYFNKNRNTIPSGFADNLVGYDFAANALGAHVGIRLSNPRLTEEKFDRIIKDLNDPKWYATSQE